MNISFGGVEWNSFIDYDGYLSAVLFVNGCSLNCEYCHNKHLLDYRIKLDTDSLIKELEQRRKFIEAVTISGGEPTVHKGLTEFISILKRHDYKIKIDTNGCNYEAISKIIDKTDYIALDIKTTWQKYFMLGADAEKIENIKQTFELLKTAKQNSFEIRTTVYPPIIQLNDLIELSTIIQPKKHKWYLQNYKLPHSANESQITFKSSEIIAQFANIDLKNLRQRILIK